MSNNIKIAGVITDTNLLQKESELLVKQLSNVDKRVGKYLLSEIAHIEVHRNPTRLNQFFEALHKNAGIRKAAMRAYVLAFGNVREGTKVNDKGQTVLTGKLVMNKTRSDAVAQYNITQAIATDWRTFKPETEAKDFDIAKAIQKLLTDAFAAGYSEDAVLNTIPELVVPAKSAAEKAVKRAEDKAAKAAKAAKERKQAIEAIKAELA